MAPGSSTVQKALGDTLRGVLYADLVSKDALTTPLGLRALARYKERFGEHLVAAPLVLLAFEAVRLIQLAHQQGVPLAALLRQGPIQDGAIREYSFDSDGAVQGIPFTVKTVQ
jgi:hypothetical protein